MGQYSKHVEGEFTSTGVAKFIRLPFFPRSFEIVNKTQYSSATANKIKEAFSYVNDTAATAYITYNGAASTVANKTIITSGGFTWIDAGTPTFGPSQSASGANSVDKDTDFMTVNITSHGYQTGDVVWLTGTTGMLQIAGMPYTITRVDANSFTIPIDTSAYTFAADATAVTAKILYYSDLYIPFLITPVGIISASAPHADWAVITTNVDHQFVVGQRVKFRIPSQWGMVELDGLDGIVQDVGNIDNAQAYTVVTDGSPVNAFRVNIDVSGFTAFDFPASAAVGMDFPQAIPVGDENFGYIYNGGTPLNRVLGAFVANTRQGVLVGLGNGTQVMHVANDVIHWRAELPDGYNV